MKPQDYSTLCASTAGERSTALKTATTTTASQQKLIAKILVAMVATGDCKPGELKTHAQTLTGKNIKEEFQNVYPLVTVFGAIVEKQIDLTEADFDTLDGSKLALLATFMGEKHKDKLPDALAKVKGGGTAAEIRALKPKTPPPPPAVTPPATIPVAFAVTDIQPDESLLRSQQVRNRLRDDMQRAIDTANTGEQAFLLEKFARAYDAVCQALGLAPLDVLADIAAERATPAKGETVAPVPALAAA